MKKIDESTVDQYKWLKIGQAIILVVIGVIFVITSWLSDSGISAVLSYCLAVVFVVYGTLDIVAGYLLCRNPVNSQILIGLLSISFAVVLFFKSSILQEVLSIFLIALFFGIAIMLVVSDVDRIFGAKKLLKQIEAEKKKVDDTDFEHIRQLKNRRHKTIKNATLFFVAAFFILALGGVYLYFFLTQREQVERYLLLAIGAIIFVLGIFSLVTTLKKIKNTKDMLLEEKMSAPIQTYNTSDEVRNKDVKIIDISELKSKRRKRIKKTEKTTPPEVEAPKDYPSLPPTHHDDLDGD